jgi:alkylation response protein AidB-like acyl-CoA dehydrogenase
MNFEITQDDAALRDATRRFAREYLAPGAARADRDAAFPDGHFERLAQFGAMGLNLPAEHGGAGAPATGLAFAVEEIAAACAATASSVTAHYLATDAILLGGDDAMRKRWLPDAAAGGKLGAFALTEPGAGSDPADMSMQATREGNGYRLRGTKHFITNGGDADFVVVFVKTDPGAGYRGISAFVVEAGTPGFEIGAAEDSMGIRASRIHELRFDCVVPTENLIGEEGGGFRTAMRVLDRGRGDIAAMACGIARAALEAALVWARERKISSQPLADFQAIQFMLADMKTELEAARLMTLRAAALREAGERFTREAAMAKLFALHERPAAGALCAGRPHPAYFRGIVGNPAQHRGQARAGLEPVRKRLQHRVHRVADRRRHAEFAPEAHHHTGQPFQFQPVATFQIAQHRRLHFARQTFGEAKLLVLNAILKPHALGAPDSDGLGNQLRE